MTFLQVLTATILGFILREAPNVARHEELKKKFNDDIASTVELHYGNAAPGLLYDSQTDVLILSAVTYRESRFRLPPADGDCHNEHAYLHVPRLQWPAGYTPVWHMECRAVGPQQLNKGNTKHLPPWKEIQELFPGRDWATAEGRKKDKLTEKQLRDPATNIRLSYGVLAHWKNECRQKDGTDAPVGVWFTAYRQGRCPFLAKTGKYFIDDEAKTRCDLIQKMADGFDASVYALPQGFRCVYPSKKATKNSTTVEASWSQ
jgi:hypothetical protein